MEMKRHNSMIADNDHRASQDDVPRPRLPAKLSKFATIAVEPISLYNRDFPNYRQPKEIGYFSTDANQQFCDDDHMLHFYISRPSNGLYFNLMKGYSNFIRKNESINEHLNYMLQWIVLHKLKFSLKNEESSLLPSLHTDFVCWRGLLTRLLCTPYENLDGWMIAVTLYRGTLYLCEFETEKKENERLRRTVRQDQMCYWGWKFEQYVTADKPDGRPDINVPVNNKASYSTVVRTRLESHSLVFAGEVDAVDESVTPKTYVELKTSREITNQKQSENFKRYKLLKWWAQSFLPGVPRIVAGLRDDDGVVHSLEEYSTQDIPKIAKTAKNAWEPCICFNFLNDVLAFLKSSVTIDDCRHVHLLTRKERAPRAVLEDVGTDSQYQFLPSWYTDHFKTF